MPLNITAIRKQFPLLNQKIDRHPLVYFDNAATTQKPQAVLTAVDNFYKHSNANVHRGINPLAEDATAKYEDARAMVRYFLNAHVNQEIIFTSGATAGINLVAQTWGRANLQAGDRIVLSVAEHHANFVPWLQLKKQTGVVIDVFGLNADGQFNIQEAKKLLKQKKVKLFAMSLGSNVLGSLEMKRMQDLRAWARQHGIAVIVDAAQVVSHTPLNVRTLQCDFLVFSGHKLYAPTGIGVLYGRKEILAKMPAWQGGGDMISQVSVTDFTVNELPYKFEAGTPNISGAIGLGAAIRWLNKNSLIEIIKIENELNKYFLAQSKKFKFLKLYGPKNAKNRLPVFSLSIAGVHAHDAADLLGEAGIIVRAGHHCAQPLHDYLNTPATLRISLSFYNTKKEIDSFFKQLYNIYKKFN